MLPVDTNRDFWQLESQMKIPVMKYLIPFQISFLLVASQVFAEDAHVTLWVQGLDGDEPISKSELKLEAGETAYLVSWMQNEFKASFMEIWSGGHSVIVTRNPEFEVDQKEKSVKKHGTVPLPDLVVAGPATVELSTMSNTAIFCTFRIVKGDSRVVVPQRIPLSK